MSKEIRVRKDQFPAVLRRAHSHYQGGRFHMAPGTSVCLHDDAWSGGTKYSYSFVELATGRVVASTAEFCNMFSAAGQACRGQAPDVGFEPGWSVVIHKRFCGSDLGLTAIVHPDDWGRLAPAEEERPTLSTAESEALQLIRSTKGGAYRRDEWTRNGLPGKYSGSHPLVSSLVDKGLAKVNKAGSVTLTLAGRNY